MRPYRRQSRRPIAGCLSCAALLCLQASAARAISPHLALTQLAHTAWRVQGGALPGTPNVITQTRDGYIWIGTEAGLIRFDGTAFVPVSPPPAQAPAFTQITALYGARDGSLWIGTASQLLRLKDGKFHLYRSPVGLFAAVREAPDGSIWATRYHTPDNRGPLCEALAKRLECFGPDRGIPFKNAGALAIDGLGRVWVASSDRLARWAHGHSQIMSAPAQLTRDQGLEGFKAVALAPDGTVWAGMINGGPGLGLQHLVDGAWAPVVSGGMNSSDWEVTALLVDRDHTLWVGTADKGIYRIAGSRIEHFGVRDGLTADWVKDIFEDHEGDIWVATSGGIDKFHALPVVTLSSRQGLSADGVEAVATSPRGAVWVSNSTALNRIMNGKVTTYDRTNGLPGRSTTALFEDAHGRLWAGVDNRVAVFDHGRFSQVRSNGHRIGPILEFAAGPGRTVWGISATVPSWLVRMSEAKALQFIPAPKGTRFATLASGPGGALWLGLLNPGGSTDLVRFAHGKWRTFHLHNPPHSGNFGEILAPGAHTVFVATDGIVELHDGILHRLSTNNGLPCARVLALVFDHRRNLWAYLQCGIAMITSKQLARWWRDPATKLRIRLLDATDGAVLGYADFHPRAAVSADGKIWFANGTDLQFVDPGHRTSNPVIPPVHIESLDADGRDYAVDSSISLPPLTRNIEIHFTALSFVVPRRVQFRYRLDGWNRHWQNPRERRQALYTNLPPGHYRFSVIASNNDGLWNRKGASVGFNIEPAYYQTWWFRVLCAAVALGLIQFAYVYRLHRAKARIRQRLAVRLGERERIARELHDTLLQGIQGVVLKFHALAGTLPSDSSARTKLDSVLAQARAVIEEGRARVRDLRGSDHVSHTLAEQLSSYGSGFSHSHECAFSTSVVGQPVALNPVAADEVLAIGREAITNAIRHAEAQRIEVEVIYDDKSLAVRIRDDGIGMEQETAQAGRPDHWGIVGMRERARSLGAKLNIWSRPGSGTEVELTVPAAVAYGTRAEAGGRRRPKPRGRSE